MLANRSTALEGVTANVTMTGKTFSVLAGNLALLRAHGVDEVKISQLNEHTQRYLATGCTVTYTVATAADTACAGIIALADTPRETARATVADLHDAGAEPVLLTGDNAAAAQSVTAALGITEFKAECRPEDKLDWIAGSEASGHPVCMVGDGVNDAPALKRAQVGIAMGGVGSDIAVDAADIALVGDGFSALPHLVRLSRRMMATIKLNMAFSLTLNFIAITLAILGILNPVVGALVHNAGSVLVISNSALLLSWKES